MSAPEWGLLICLSIFWGGSFFFIAVAVRELPLFTIVALRLGIAAVVLLFVIRALHLALPHQPIVWRSFLIMGLLNNAVPFLLIVWGQRYIASSVASILNATTPLFTVVVAHYLTVDEKISGARVTGVICGAVGVAIMVGWSTLESLGVNVVAEMTCLLASLSYAFAAVFGRRFKRMDIAPLATATGMVVCSSVLLFPLAILADRPWALALPSWQAVASIAGIALFSTALGYVLYFRLLASAGASNLLLVTFLSPVTAILLGTLLLGETLQVRHVEGMLLIGAGLTFIDGRPYGALRRFTSGQAK